ncbi:SAVED domain-containing protein [Ketobacter sp. MCCC 1A13808]|uniref:SAVED domain-containing protein n=1 Tax=Ketobacter sp. MCCC 1A13808 TaxID=2602738 RepID=UPI0012EBA1DB|nr:SAVED domain-containing protein [Ketobacter sp. MCCC 1A13808]MVF14465.1 SAVED domain-containing protein [Ketobacter sp. MCCC 1A13808]
MKNGIQMQNRLKESEVKSSGLSDAELAAWLSLRHSTGKTVVYAYAKHVFKVYEQSAEPSQLVVGDLGTESVPVLKTLSKKNMLKRIELPCEVLVESTTSRSDWMLLDAKVKDITELKKARDELFGQGRGKAISPLTSAKVWHDAGGRCMYRGCGQDLGATPLTTKTARIAYLAHIIASDPDGPRGNENSHALSDVPENIMLMCDGHHRLIDRIDVIGHPASDLQLMRDEHAAKVSFLLDSLKYPTIQLITLLADLAQVPTNVSKSELCNSALSRKLGPLPEIKHMIRRTQRDDRSRPGFWGHFLHEHESDVRELISFTSNRPSQTSLTAPDALGIFPLHLVPVLVLAGRIIGEARNVEIFQYDRNLKTWSWPEHNLTPDSKFDISYEIESHNNGEETILSFELTAELDINALPEELAQAVQEKKIGWVRITNATPSPNCINSKERLENFSSLARQAIKMIQDSWRSKMVHVFGVSPASAIFKFGQMLQAGNHSVCRVYDRPDGSKPFTPALDITGNDVLSVSSEGEHQHQISLR